jgi:urease accessory protein
MGEDATLEAFRLADSFLPVGTNSISSGIEQFVQEGRIEDLDDLRAVLETYLRNQVGTADLVALRAAHEAARDDDVAAVSAADRRLTAVTLPAEFREAASHSGARLLSLQCDLRPDPVLDAYAAAVDDGTAPGNHPVVLGAVAGRTGIGERKACLVYCHGFLTGLLGAAQRLLSVGHTGVQRTLDGLGPIIREAVDGSDARTLDDMMSFTPVADVLSAEHERADRRLFLS